MRYSEGLILAHAFLILSFLIGASYVTTRDDNASKNSASEGMVRVVCTCGLGFAAIGFVCFLLALIDLFNPPAVFAALVVCFAAGCYWRRESPFQAVYWRSRFHALSSCWDAPILGVYYLMLVLALPAVNLANIGTDPLAYHLAYAADWAATGRLVVDPFLDPPFYANNFLLLDAFFLMLHAQAFVVFLVWTTGLLTALGIFASVRWLLGDQGVRSVWSASAAFFLTLSVVFSASYFGWFISAYVDVPIGAFALLATLAMVIGVRNRRPDWLVGAAVISGFLIGMKVSYLPLAAVFGIALWIAARDLRLPRKAVLALLAALIVASSPWYVRNWITAGDPIPPVFNLMLYGKDGLFTRFEADSLAQNLHGVRTPQALATLPIRAFTDVDDTNFAADGVSALILALYLPPLVFLLALVQARRMVTKDILIAAFICCMLAAYWAFSSTSLRYATIFFPLLAVCIGMTLGLPFLRSSWRGPIVPLLAGLTLIPTPGTTDYFRRIFAVDFQGLPAAYQSDAQYQSDVVDGYREVQFVSARLRRVPGRALVYVVGRRSERLNYYFRLNGIQDAGGWVGPGGWFRLYSAIDAGMATEFLNDLGVTAVLMDPAYTLGRLDEPLARQLVSHGYCAVHIPQSRFTFYVRCAAIKRV